MQERKNSPQFQKSTSERKPLSLSEFTEKIEKIKVWRKVLTKI